MFTGSAVDFGVSAAVLGRTRRAAPVVLFDSFFITSFLLLWKTRLLVSPSFLEPPRSAVCTFRCVFLFSSRARPGELPGRTVLALCSSIR